MNDPLIIAKRYVDLVRTRYALQRAYLFGSSVRGASTSESDIDIALILTDPGDVFETRIELMKLRRQIDLRIEPHPFDKKDFDENDSLANEIMKYGVEIDYEVKNAR